MTKESENTTTDDKDGYRRTEYPEHASRLCTPRTSTKLLTTNTIAPTVNGEQTRRQTDKKDTSQTNKKTIHDTHDQQQRKYSIGEILKNFSGFVHTISIKTRRKHVLMTNMEDLIGTNKNDRQDTADALAEFYDSRNQPQHAMTPLTVQELDTTAPNSKRQSSKHEGGQYADPKYEKTRVCDCTPQSSYKARTQQRTGVT